MRTFVPVMVKAIVFDLGGVLIDLDFDRCVRAFRENSSRRTSSARRS